MKRAPARQRILQAALKLFSQHGYQGTTTRQIAHAAEVAELTLFRHFKTKEGLFNAVLKEFSVLPALKGLMGRLEGLDYGDALTLIAKSFLDRLMERADLISILQSEIQRYPEKVRKIHHAVILESHDTIAAYFKLLQDRGEIGSFDPALGARAFLGMFFAYFLSLRFLPARSSWRLDEDVIVQEYVNIFVNGTTASVRR